jgi:sulfopyruvate decarboxylase TPP-binding subunit
MNQTNEIDERNQINQIPATRREMVTGVCPCLMVLAEVQSQAMAPSSTTGFCVARRL